MFPDRLLDDSKIFLCRILNKCFSDLIGDLCAIYSLILQPIGCRNISLVATFQLQVTVQHLQLPRHFIVGKIAEQKRVIFQLMQALSSLITMLLKRFIENKNAIVWIAYVTRLLVQSADLTAITGHEVPNDRIWHT